MRRGLEEGEGERTRTYARTVIEALDEGSGYGRTHGWINNGFLAQVWLV